MSAFVKFYKKIWHEAAESVSAEISEISSGIWKVSYHDRSVFINNYKVQIDDPVILDIAGRKALCYRLLAEKRLPVPDYEVFSLDEFQKALRFMQSFPNTIFVVKPSVGTSGARGVSTGIRSVQECKRAVALASLYGREILIERWIPGESCRLLILNGRLIHASRRKGVHVRGDGRDNIDQLVSMESQRRRDEGGAEGFCEIEKDDDYHMTLKSQDLTEDFVPKSGEEVLVKSHDHDSGKFAEVRTVYNEDITRMICKELQEEAVESAKALGSQFAGVDILTVNPSLPLRQTGGVINEVNTTPGLHHHYNLSGTQDVPPAIAVLEYLLKK